MLTDKGEMVEDGHIKYSRKGGYFVTTRKAIFYLVATVSLSLSVGLLVYQYGPRKETQVVKHENIEEILSNSLNNMPEQDIRLAPYVRPKHYKLILRPDIDELIIYGEAIITLETTQKSKYITLNVNELTLDKISVIDLHKNELREKRGTENQNVTKDEEVQKNGANGTTSTNSNVTQIQSTTESNILKIEDENKMPEHIHILSKQTNKENFQYMMHLAKPLLPQKTYALHINYTGRISEALQGLHLSTYVNNKGKKLKTLISHMQPIFARNVFPCFDEPSMKATFEITILHKENMISLSNMPLQRRNRRTDGWIEDNFETTPPMPTYLVAIILMDLEYTSSAIRDFNASIWAFDEYLPYAEKPLSSTGSILQYFSEYFNMSYPLPKLDIVAIPALLSTATENWGLIFYRESELLNGINDRDIFTTLARKLAQQWFGNLVSIEWWNDLWLVKGFAFLMAEEATNNVRNWTSDFSLKITQKMLALDDFSSAPKLEVHVKNTLEINRLFDSVTHYKGSCLLRMLKDSIPGELFRESVREFLQDWRYKSTNRYEFWQKIDNNAQGNLPNGTNVTEIMRTWTSRTGYPLITVSRNGNTLNITQSTFHHTNDSSISSSANDKLWIVPLNYIIGGGSGGGASEERRLWLTNRSITVSNVSSDNKWILFNVKRTGYYRVNYDNNNWGELIKVLNTNHNAIPIENRGQLINDAFKLAENGQLDYKVALNLTSYLHRETEYIPWASVLESLAFLRQILQSTYLNGAYEEYVISLISNLYDNLKNGSSIDGRLKKLIISTACDVNYQPCIKWARACYKNSNEGEDCPYNLRQTIFCSTIKHGGKAEWELLWKELQIQKSNTDIEELFMSLGCTRDTWLINKYMRNALSGDIPWQYVPFVWKSLSQPTSIAFGFKYLRENWSKIYYTYKDKPLILNTIVTNFLYALSSKSDLEDLTLLASKHQKDLQQLAPLIKGVVDRIRMRVAWSDKYLNEFHQLLSQYINKK